MATPVAVLLAETARATRRFSCSFGAFGGLLSGFAGATLSVDYT
jgi:hypothetical protein